MTIYIAKCRTETCLWNQSPPRFTDYGERATAVGKHRITTGHTVDFDAEETAPSKDLYLAFTDDAVVLVCEREECMVEGPKHSNNEAGRYWLQIELPWECTPAEAMRTATQHMMEKH